MSNETTWTRTPEETARAHGTERDLRFAAQVARRIAAMCDGGADYFGGRAADGGPLVSSEYHRAAAGAILARLSDLEDYINGRPRCQNTLQADLPTL